MALDIFGKKEFEEEIARLESKIAALENQLSSELTKNVTNIEKKITKLAMESTGLKKEVVANSGVISGLRASVEKNSSIIEKQVEEAIPLEIEGLHGEIAEIAGKFEIVKGALGNMMKILRQVTDPSNRLNQKVLMLEDQIEVMGKVDILHLVDKLEVVKEQLRKAQENFIPPEITEKLQRLDLQLHNIEKRLEEVEDQMIRPVEEVELYSK